MKKFDQYRCFYNPKNHLEVHPMSKEESKVFLQLSVAGLREGAYETMLTTLPTLQLAHERVRRQGVSGGLPSVCDAATALMFGSVLEASAGNPGAAIMWAYTAMLWTAENGAPLTLSDVAEHLFPIGFPDRQGMSRVWDEQKGYRITAEDLPEGYDKLPADTRVDNVLDLGILWSPLANEINKTTPANVH